MPFYLCTYKVYYISFRTYTVQHEWNADIIQICVERINTENFAIV